MSHGGGCSDDTLDILFMGSDTYVDHQLYISDIRVALLGDEKIRTNAFEVREGDVEKVLKRAFSFPTEVQQGSSSAPRGPHILQYFGHGRTRGKQHASMFHDNDHSIHASRQLRTAKSKPLDLPVLLCDPCVCNRLHGALILSCNSSSYPTAKLLEHMGFIISCPATINKVSTHRFSENFYCSIKEGASLGESFEAGCRHVRSVGGKQASTEADLFELRINVEKLTEIQQYWQE